MPDLPLERFRAYLLVLAGAQLPAPLRAVADAAGVVEETLREARRHAGEFRGTTGGAWAAWLRGLLARQLAQAAAGWNRAAAQPPEEEALAASAARLEAWLAAGARRTDDLLALTAAVAGLPADQREAVELRYLRGLPLKEVAARVRRPPAAVAGLLHRGLTRLHALLTEPAEP
jgi:RNA polymerase sigma-70 factor (ECF subfamily)